VLSLLLGRPNHGQGRHQPAPGPVRDGARRPFARRTAAGLCCDDLSRLRHLRIESRRRAALCVRRSIRQGRVEEPRIARRIEARAPAIFYTYVSTLEGKRWKKCTHNSQTAICCSLFLTEHNLRVLILAQRENQATTLACPGQMKDRSL
jgi:hypothetical protein